MEPLTAERRGKVAAGLGCCRNDRNRPALQGSGNPNKMRRPAHGLGLDDRILVVLQCALKSQHNRTAGDGVVHNNQGPRGQSLEKHGDNLRLGDWILTTCAAPERKRRGRIFGCSLHSIPIGFCQQEHRSTRNAFCWYMAAMSGWTQKGRKQAFAASVPSTSR